MEIVDIFNHILTFLDFPSKINLVCVSKKYISLYIPNILIALGKTPHDQQCLHNSCNNKSLTIRLKEYYEPEEIITLDKLCALIDIENIYFDKISLSLKHLCLLVNSHLTDWDYDTVRKMEECCKVYYDQMEKYKASKFKIIFDWIYSYQDRLYFSFDYHFFEAIPKSINYLVIVLDDNSIYTSFIDPLIFNVVSQSITILEIKKKALIENTIVYLEPVYIYKTEKSIPSIEKIIFPKNTTVIDTSILPQSIKEITVGENTVIHHFRASDDIIINRY